MRPTSTSRLAITADSNPQPGVPDEEQASGTHRQAEADDHAQHDGVRHRQIRELVAAASPITASTAVAMAANGRSFGLFIA